ncbi:MAG: hypothetical protein Q9N34_10645 [Aquificota bacterium]|nr:hypothetical protein [Aquificota bacterium]
MYFFRGSSFVDLAVQTGADVLSVDWSVDLPSEMVKRGPSSSKEIWTQRSSTRGRKP